MRNYKYKRTLATVSILFVIAIASYFLLFQQQSSSSNSDETPKDQLLAAFPEGSGQVEALSSVYRKVADNDRLQLSVKEENLSIQVIDKRTGYTWSSEIVDPDMNVQWKNFIASGLSMDIFESQKQIATRTDLISQANKSIRIETIENGFKAIVRLNDLKIGMDLHVTLDGDQLKVLIPQESILEGPDFKLGSIYVYPFLGATKAGEVDGYLFIPDGSGALIRMADNKGKFKTPYDAKIYGTNEGIESPTRDVSTNPAYQVQYPVFGLVHGEGKHGLFGIVEQGQFNANLLAYPNGVQTPYNWTTAKFLLRESYMQPTSRSMGGIIVFEKLRNKANIQIRYTFLHDKEASYVGMAKEYQRYLVEKQVLIKKEAEYGNSGIPLNIDVLGAETENGLLNKQLILLTTAAQLRDIMEDLTERQGVKNLTVVYKGWNEGGLSGTNPAPVKFESKLGTKEDFEQLNDVHFYGDFTTAYEETKRFSTRSDAAIKIDKRVLEIPTFEEVYDTMYYMSAKISSQIMEENAKSYVENDIKGIAADHTGYILFSEMVDDIPVSRKETAETYQAAMAKLADQIPSFLLYAPNDYMLPYADQVLNVPLDSSGYKYISETVPFAQILLKGYKDYYAPYANFIANSKENLLRMIETGSYPSYYLTHEQSYKLKFTNSNDVYTSAYQDWREDIAQTYGLVNQALKPVRNAEITGHTYLADRVVKVSYSNGVSIVVNYTSKDFKVEQYSVPARGFQLIEVNN